MESFGHILRNAMNQFGPLCVGIDPHPQLLEEWGLDDTASGVEYFTMTVLEALGGRVAALKPQSAFFERHGSRGIAVLERFIAEAQSTSTLTVVDAKRGDVGSTMTGYADAYVSAQSPLGGNSVTLSPYLGYSSLNGFIQTAYNNSRGVFILCLTSNPEGAEIQHAVDKQTGMSIAAQIADYAAQKNSAEMNTLSTAMGSVGLVVGATIGTALRENNVDIENVHGPLLVPGFGAQGAGPDEIRTVFGSAISNVLVSSSRGILRHGPNMKSLREAFNQSVEELSFLR